MRRVLPYLALVALAVGLVFVLRHRKRQFVAAHVELLQCEDAEEAKEARKRLQRIGRSAAPPVCAVLEHEDPEVRARAALTLANIGHAAACGPLMEAAKRGYFAAADALAFMKHPQAKKAPAWAWCRLVFRGRSTCFLGKGMSGVRILARVAGMTRVAAPGVAPGPTQRGLCTMKECHLPGMQGPRGARSRNRV